MGDDERALERVGGSRRRPAVWIGGWALGIVTVAAVAMLGRGTPSVEDAAGLPTPSPPPLAAAPAPTSTPTLPDGLPRISPPVRHPPSPVGATPAHAG